MTKRASSGPLVHYARGNPPALASLARAARSLERAATGRRREFLGRYFHGLGL